jgi:hypothetical protein
MFPKSAQRILDKNMFKVCEHVPKKCAADFGRKHMPKSLYSISNPLDSKFIADLEAMRALGILTTAQLREIANRALDSGCIDDNIIDFHLNEDASLADAIEVFSLVRDAHKVESMTVECAFRYYVYHMSVQIIANAVTPQEGVSCINRVRLTLNGENESLISNSHVADPFAYIWSSFEGNPVMFSAAAKAEAERWVSHGPAGPASYDD